MEGKRVATDTLRSIVKDKENIIDVEFEKLKIRVKQYLPIEEKRTIVDIIVASSFVVDKTKKLKRHDLAIQDAMTGYFIIRSYTNINPMSDPFEMYDVVKSTGLLEFVIQKIPLDEMLQFEDILDDRIDEEIRLQRLNVEIGHVFEDMVGLISRKASEALDVITKFDPNQLSTLTSFLSPEQKAEIGVAEDEVKAEEVKQDIEIVEK